MEFNKWQICVQISILFSSNIRYYISSELIVSVYSCTVSEQKYQLRSLSTHGEPFFRNESFQISMDFIQESLPPSYSSCEWSDFTASIIISMPNDCKDNGAFPTILMRLAFFVCLSENEREREGIALRTHEPLFGLHFTVSIAILGKRNLIHYLSSRAHCVFLCIFSPFFRALCLDFFFNSVPFASLSIA